MFQRLLGPTTLTVAAIASVASVSSIAIAQQASRSHHEAPIGTYATGTKRLPSSGSDGCWLEAALVSADTMHVQILCRYPAPGHHLGALDARLHMGGDTVVYQRRETPDECRIHMRFARGRALVTQHGSDLACGFGAFVDVSGTYIRLSSRRPPFDLVPIERAPAARPGERHARL
jgi:hypothetical protein